MVNDRGYFIWFELMTTNMAAAAAFYRNVVGWGTQEASTSKLPYTLFMAGEAPATGLIELPEEGRRMGATPRWMGYVGVSDVRATVERIKHLGGAVYVPPTDTNIGLISVVSDPGSASFALIDRMQIRPQQPTESGKIGRVGWNELLAADPERELAFYFELFGWQKALGKPDLLAGYCSFSAGGLVIGGAQKMWPEEPAPFWLFYFNVDDLDAAIERVEAGGGKAVRNEMDLPSGISVARCVDPQGAAFALQGKRGHDPKIGWRTEWQGFSSRGRLVAPKPRRESDK
ncbi:VOC family protein [Bradyrhizobium sp.]|uniref:VOC family protein n=1 Tax=Bradyrhizobium sp. TaxID=376 RepID=UPI002624BF5F|nr:VOC family protein [Bradyrhizobium sp.]